MICLHFSLPLPFPSQSRSSPFTEPSTLHPEGEILLRSSHPSQSRRSLSSTELSLKTEKGLGTQRSGFEFCFQQCYSLAM